MRVNKVMLAGNLTRDPELVGSEDNVCKFGMAINDYKDKVHFIEVTAFNRGTYLLAENINSNFAKGSPIFIEGRLDYTTWESKDGDKRNQLGVVVDNFQFVGKKDDNDNQPF
jgi:single-strand DNA-binding protein